MRRIGLVSLDTLRESYALVKRDIILKNIKFQKILIKA